MIQQFDSKTRSLIKQIKDWSGGQAHIYLVGGAIRDAISRRSIKDLDFVVPGETKSIVSRLRKRFDAQAFVLDDERQTARIILKQDGELQMMLDFVRMNAKGLQEDLAERDYTINAIALDLQHPEEWIDPCHGVSDLAQGVLRCCSPKSIILDPLRILRGVRLALDYDLKIEDASINLMRDSASDLQHISRERVRDELFKILQGTEPIRGVRLVDEIGCFFVIFPELSDLQTIPAHPPHVHPLWEHTLHTADYLARIIDLIQGQQEEEGTFPEHLIMAFDALTPSLEALRDHFSDKFPENRSRRGLLLLAALYHDAGKPESLTFGDDRRAHFYGHENPGSILMDQGAKKLALSHAENVFLTTLVKNHMRVHLLAMEKDEISDKAIHRFFRDCGDTGIDICLLSVADLLATYDHLLPNTQFFNEIEIVKRLLHVRFNQANTVIKPPILLDGNDVKAIFSIEPGPMIKDLLTALHEAQAAQEVSTRDEAIRLLRSLIANTRK